MSPISASSSADTRSQSKQLLAYQCCRWVTNLHAKISTQFNEKTLMRGEWQEQLKSQIAVLLGSKSQQSGEQIEHVIWRKLGGYHIGC